MYYDRYTKYVYLSEEPIKNVITHDGATFLLKPLRENTSKSPGSNSSVFSLIDPNNGIPERVIKISKIYRTSSSTLSVPQRRRFVRFVNEIDALNRAKDNGLDRVVSIEGDGVLAIDQKEFYYFIMEKATMNLREYLLTQGTEIDNQEKVGLCYAIFTSLSQLHSMELYHRDIKPDNVLLFGSPSEGSLNWKLGDLGLLNSRNQDFDAEGERVGAFGWSSPEVMNKYLTEKVTRLTFDCAIDECSDIFQLGKLFWFIFQCNVPIGHTKQEDFLSDTPQREFIFEMILKMLQYAKSRRLTTEELKTDLELLAWEFRIGTPLNQVQ